MQKNRIGAGGWIPTQQVSRTAKQMQHAAPFVRELFWKVLRHAISFLTLYSNKADGARRQLKSLREAS